MTDDPNAQQPDKLSEVEFAKNTIDYLKHITTLASGTLVLMAAFLNRFHDVIGKPLITGSIAALAACIFLSSITMLALLAHAKHEDLRTEKGRHFLSRTLTFTVICFVLGMWMLGMSMILNVVFAK